jgi:hypothetical protein
MLIPTDIANTLPSLPIETCFERVLRSISPDCTRYDSMQGSFRTSRSVSTLMPTDPKTERFEAWKTHFEVKWTGVVP